MKQLSGEGKAPKTYIALFGMRIDKDIRERNPWCVSGRGIWFPLYCHTRRAAFVQAFRGLIRYLRDPEAYQPDPRLMPPLDKCIPGSGDRL